MQIVIRMMVLLVLFGLSACHEQQATTTPQTADTVDSQVSQGAESQTTDAVVGGDSPNAFNTIQAALDAAPADEAMRYRILVKAGSYKEKLNITRANTELRGEGAASTIIHFDAYAAISGHYREDGWGTPGSATVSVNAVDVHIAELTIDNTFDYLTNDAKKAGDDPAAISDSQAVAVLLDTHSDRVSFSRVTLNGYQDTLFVHGYRAYFYQSTISGNVDFIFGQGTVVFDQSTIVTRPRNRDFAEGEIQSFITAPSTNIGREYGLTFIDCLLMREQGVSDQSITLGRPWHPTTTFPDGRYADPDAIGKAVFIRTFMDSHISPEGWSSMGGTARDGTKTRIFTPQESRFFEYQSTGPGAAVNAQRPQLTDEQAAEYSLEKIFGDWQPQNYANTYTVENRFKQDVQNYPFINIASRAVPEGVVEHKSITYVRYGERELQLDLYLPANLAVGEVDNPVPGVVLIHGGGWRSGYRTHLTPMAIELAKAGYVAATISYRLAPEAQYPAAIHDVKAAIRWLRSNAAQYQVDPARIAVGGSSAGGQIASLTAVTNGLARLDPQVKTSDISSAAQLVLNIDGLSDFTSAEARKYEDVRGKDSSAGSWFGGGYAKKRELWHDASPIYYVSENTPSILFLNSAQERFHVGRDEMIEKMKGYDIPSKVVTLPDTPHTFWLYEPWIKPAAAEMVAFLEEQFGQ
jgi:pectinesterase